MVNGNKSDWAPVLSGVPQGTVLGSLLLSLYINDITEDIDSELGLFAADCVCYREIKDTEDTVKLQKDIDCLECWARSLGMRFQPVKCNIVQITRKRIKKINASYSLVGTVLENVEKIKYLGVTITGGGWVVRRCWVNFLCRGVLPVWIRVGQGPIVLAIGAGGGCLDIFSLVYHFSFPSPSLWEAARYRLKYCLKGPLSPKTTTTTSNHYKRFEMEHICQQYLHKG